VGGPHPTVDLYAVLGVAPHASGDEIVRAYRRLARAAHPDARPGDPGAAARFRRLTAAYAVLSDPVQRDDYDRSRRDRPGGTPAHPPSPTSDTPGPSGGRRNASDHRGSAAPLWAGPVRVEPPDSPRGLRDPGRATTALADLAALLIRYVDDLWTMR
jgi:curved DNA-binding protein CbpA